MQFLNELILSENGFVFDASIGESYVSNLSGQTILKLIKKGKSQKEIKEELLKQYEVSESELERDIEDFIASLKRFNLIS